MTSPHASAHARRPALFSKRLARQLAGQFGAVADDELLRDCLDQATAGTLDTWQLDTLTRWTREAIDNTPAKEA